MLNISYHKYIFKCLPALGLEIPSFLQNTSASDATAALGVVQSAAPDACGENDLLDYCALLLLVSDF